MMIGDFRIRSLGAVKAQTILLALLAASSIAGEARWPDLGEPAPTVGGGESDAAVVVGIEDYFALPDVPGAKSNALAWYDYLTRTRKLRPENVTLLRDADGTEEEMKQAAALAAEKAGADGTLWFVYIGHGAQSKDGKDGLLVGVDAQQKTSSLYGRSLKRSDLLKTLAQTKAAAVRVVIDACFSGRTQGGESLVPGLQPLILTTPFATRDPRFVVLTGARGDQFAGSLPGASRPAFSYLVLGGLRGWADEDTNGKVSASELLGYAQRALSATLRGRDQTPELAGNESAVLARSAREKGPDLATLARADDAPSTSATGNGPHPATPSKTNAAPTNPTSVAGDWSNVIHTRKLGSPITISSTYRFTLNGTQLLGFVQHAEKYDDRTTVNYSWNGKISGQYSDGQVSWHTTYDGSYPDAECAGTLSEDGSELTADCNWPATGQFATLELKRARSR